MIQLIKGIIAGVGAIAVLLALLVTQYEDSGPALGAAGSFGLTTGVSNPVSTNGAITATSTLNYLTPGTGTTSVVINTLATNQLDVNVFVLASGTPMNLRWTVEFSHSTSSVDSERMWFPMPQSLVSNATTAPITGLGKEFAWDFASTTRHRIATSTAMVGTFDQDITSAFSFSLEDLAARWTRIVFYIPTGSLTDSRMDTLAESTALANLPSATSTNAGIQIFVIQKDPL